MNLKQKDREVAVKTPLGTDALVLRSFHGREELSRLYQFELELLSEDPAIRFEDVLGKDVTVRLTGAQGQPRYFHGMVSQFTQLAPANRYARYRAVVVPWLWFLTRSADCRVFQKKPVPDIIEEVFRQHKFDAYEVRLTDTYDPREYCVQYRETAFDFVSRLAEEEGIYYFFKHEDGKHTLVLADAPSAHAPFAGYERIGFRPPDATGKSGQHIRDWVMSKEVLTRRYAHTDYNFEMPKTDLESRSEIVRDHALGEWERFDYPGEYRKHKEGERYARIRIQEIQARYETLHGEGDTRGVCVGSSFTLEDHPRADQEREYLVVAATHTVESDFFASAGGADLGAPQYRCAFSVIPADVPFRPACLTPRPCARGPQTAVVVGPAGEELHTDAQARVKVQFHWDRYGTNDENSSCWVRVSHANAGKGWGSLITPRIGQEVVVEFLEGDPDCPIITGRVYNADQKPPYAGGMGVVSGLKSQTHKGSGYNEMSMDDAAGKEKITIHGQYDMTTTVEHDDTQTVHNDRTISVDGTHTETIKKDTTIRIAEGNFVHGVDAGTADHFVKGNLTEQCDAMRVSQVKSTIHLISETADIWIKATKHILVDSNGKSTARLGEDGKIVIDGAESIRLQSGESMIELKKDGTIKVSGKKIEIAAADEAKIGVASQNVTCDKQKVATSGTMINSTASGTHEIAGALVKIN